MQITTSFDTSKIAANVAAWIIASIITQNIVFALVGIALNAVIGGRAFLTSKN